MKVLKYIIYALFLIITVIFIFEMYLLNMDSFETEYICTTMYQPSGVSLEKMIEDIEKEAIDNNLMVFNVDRNLKSSYQTEITVYGMEGVRKTLEENSSVSEGEFHSILVGDTTFRFDDFSNITDISGNDRFYIIGSLEDARNFKSALIDKYSGNSPKEGYTYLHVKKNIFAIWTIGLLFFVLFGIFEVVVIKKETALQVVFGTSPYPIILKNILLDIAFYIGSFLVIYNIIRRHFGIYSDFHLEISVCCLLVLCVVDAFIFLSLSWMNYKKNLSQANSGKFILGIGYVFRAIMSAIIVFSMTVFVLMISQYAICRSQKDFFGNLKDYSYISADAADNTLESSEAAMESFFEKQADRGNVFLNVYLDKGMFTGRPCLMFNSGSADYLRERIPELKDINTEGKLCMIVPESIKKESISDLEFLTEMYLFDDSDYEVITYKNNISVIGMTNLKSITGNYYKNPLIILNETDVTDYYNGMYILQSAHVRVTDEEWNRFISEYNLSSRISNKTNAMKNYERQLSVYRRTALMAFSVLGVLIVLNIIITWTIVRFICTANAMEIAVKTMLGYGIAGKYKLLLFLNLITIIINGIICFCLGKIYFSDMWLYMLFGLFLIMLFDIAVTVFSIYMWEKRSVVKTLKGAVL